MPLKLSGTWIVTQFFWMFHQTVGSELQTSNGNFHTSAWTEAEKALAKSEMHTVGAPKSVLCCQNHWAAVTAIFLLDFWHVY
jgi:hypothetical protein